MIYFIGDLEIPAVKIGFTEQAIERRLYQIQATSPHRLVLLASGKGSKEDEALLHQEFAKEHIHREWFRLTPNLAAALSVILAAPYLPRPVENRISGIMRDARRPSDASAKEFCDAILKKRYEETEAVV